MATGVESKEQKRVLVVAPTTKDGEITRAILMNAGVACSVCKDLGALIQEIEAGAGAVLLTEEVVTADGIDDLLTALNKQPPWSDLPVVMMMRGASDSPAAARLLRSTTNVTLLERPAPVRSVVSAVQAALRARERQYQIRDQIQAIRQAEIHSHELQQELEIAIHASQLGTFHCEMPLGRIFWNDRCKAHFWLPPDAEIDFHLFYSILHPDDRERTRQAVEACVYGGKVYDIEYRTVSPKGELRWIRSTGRTYYDANDEPVRFDGTTQDITEHKRTEEELLTSQQRFQAMANAIPQLAWMAKPDGSIFWYNQRWHVYCGTTPGQMEGWNWRSVHDPDELPRVIEKWQAALASGEPWEDTFPLRRHDGQFRWHLSRAMPLRDASGNIILWFGTNTDITEAREKVAERQQLLESERAARQELERLSRMKDDFLATLSHELRTPLNTILGWTQLLKRGKNDPEKLAQGIDVIDRNVRLQAQLIEDLLDVSRIVSGKVHLEAQKVELPDIISAAIEAVLPAAQAKGIRLQTVIDPLASPIRADPGRLQQVLWNLLSNAIKFTPDSGRIHVLAQRVDSHVEISVTDTGEGISADFLPHLFARFSQADSSTRRKHGGLGLGLSIVKNLVEMHGGTVMAKSLGEGQGTTFVVRLPVQGAKSIDEVWPQTRMSLAALSVGYEPPRMRGVKVLVVDDDSDAGELVKRILLEGEAVPALAASAAEAKRLLLTFSPDVILSDIGMHEQDGYEFIREVREQGVKTPAVALTAFARPEDRIRSIEAGYQIHLPKPFEASELLAVVASLVGRPNKTEPK